MDEDERLTKCVTRGRGATREPLLYNSRLPRSALYCNRNPCIVLTNSFYRHLKGLCRYKCSSFLPLLGSQCLLRILEQNDVSRNDKQSKLRSMIVQCTFVFNPWVDEPSTRQFQDCCIHSFRLYQPCRCRSFCAPRDPRLSQDFIPRLQITINSKESKAAREDARGHMRHNVEVEC